MNYREIKRRIRQMAAEHLDSLEVYDEFDREDDDKVDKAIFEIQCELRRASRRRQGKDGAVK